MSELLDPVPFDYRVRVPAAPVDRFVESIWYARGTVPYTREKIAPTGSTVAVFVLGDPIIATPSDGAADPVEADRGFLLGPHDGPTLNEPTGETFAVGIVGTPIGCEAVFGISPADIAGRAVQLEEAWPAAVALGQALRTVEEPDDMLALVEDVVTKSCNAEISGIDLCQQAIALMEADPVRPIGAVADELEVSHGHLDRLFTRVVGLSPRALARLIRMRELLGKIDIRDEVGWSDYAAELGWYDQAHLIRDFKRHTGVTPSQYLAAQRATYTTVNAGDAAGFVPEA